MATVETADQETSSDLYASRFSGEIGQWFLERQSQLVFKSVVEGSSVLEVGGGHGQLVDCLLEKKTALTIYSSSDQCRHRIQEYLGKNLITFASGALLAIPFADDSFHTTISIRLLTHTAQWRALVKELCRVSRQQVIIDYPSRRSFNILYRILYPLKKSSEKTTRPFHVFTDDEIHDAFRENGFALSYHAPQFFLPMVLYRTLKNKTAAKTLEWFFSCLGLTKFFGSPTIACFSKGNFNPSPATEPS